MHRNFFSILAVFSSLEVQTRSGQGYREEIALARSIYLAEASAPAFAGVQVYLPGRSVAFRKVRYLAYTASSRNPARRQATASLKASPKARARARLPVIVFTKKAPTGQGRAKSVSQPHP